MTNSNSVMERPKLLDLQAEKVCHGLLRVPVADESKPLMKPMMRSASDQDLLSSLNFQWQQVCAEQKAHTAVSMLPPRPWTQGGGQPAAWSSTSGGSDRFRRRRVSAPDVLEANALNRRRRASVPDVSVASTCSWSGSEGSLSSTPHSPNTVNTPGIESGEATSAGTPPSAASSQEMREHKKRVVWRSSTAASQHRARCFWGVQLTSGCHSPGK